MRYLLAICFGNRDIRHFFNTELEVNTVLLPAYDLYLLEIHHVRAMTTQNIRSLESFFHRFQRVA